MSRLPRGSTDPSECSHDDPPSRYARRSRRAGDASVTGHTDLAGYLRALWRWKLLFLACVVAVVATAALLALRQPDTYSSTALVGVGQTTVNAAPLGAGGSFSTTNVDAIAELVTT